MASKVRVYVYIDKQNNQLRMNVPLSVDEMIQSGLRFSHDEWLDKKE